VVNVYVASSKIIFPVDSGVPSENVTLPETLTSPQPIIDRKRNNNNIVKSFVFIV
jgi:hypothetical protein